MRMFYSDENRERYRRAETMAKARDVATIQIALAYGLNQSFPSAAIIGPRNEVELLSCVEATQIALSDEECRGSLDNDGHKRKRS